MTVNRLGDYATSAHCPTCVCFTDSFTVESLNRRVAGLLQSGKIAPPTPSEALASRITTSPVYNFGMRPFVPSSSNRSLGALVLVGLKPTYELVEPPPPVERDRNGKQEVKFEYHADEAEQRRKYNQWRYDHRFFAIIVPNPFIAGAALVPFEYKMGDAFDTSITTPPYYEDLPAIAAMSDEDVCAWIQQSMDELHRFVEIALKKEETEAEG